MGLTINSNPAAIKAAFSLNKNNAMLQKSLARLSSGRRIVGPADDAGGLAVSMKLGASIGRTKAAISNIQNALSFGEVQDGALQSTARIVERMAELKSLSLDVMKSEADKSNYDTEFNALQQQLYQLAQETFNGVSMFAATSGKVFGTDNVTVGVYTSDRGSAGAEVSLNKSLLLSAVTFTGTTDTTAIAYAASATTLAFDSSGAGAVLDMDTIGVSFFTAALENIATLRAENGATMARLDFAETTSD